MALKDGKVSRKEENWAAKLAEIKAKLEEGEMKEYYEVVKVNFDQKLKMVTDQLPEDTETSKKLLLQKLNELMDILDKSQDKKFVTELKNSLRAYAKRVESTTENWSEVLALFADPMLGANDPTETP